MQINYCNSISCMYNNSHFLFIQSNSDFCSFHRKENTALRANVRPDLISVIPNAVDTAIFKPDKNKKHGSKSKSLEQYFSYIYVSSDVINLIF